MRLEMKYLRKSRKLSQKLGYPWNRKKMFDTKY